MSDGRGWYTRGYLPHLDLGAVPQFLTWRLADALPKQVLHIWEHELASLPETDRKHETAKRINEYCDAGQGSCHLANASAAQAVQETLFHDHGLRYELHAWVIMPNHVHILLTPIEGATLGDIVESLKKFSSNRIHKRLGGSGRLWQPDYFDRMVRDGKHFEGVIHYIEWNPVKAGLCSDPKHWPWSSANEGARARLTMSAGGE